MQDDERLYLFRIYEVPTGRKILINEGIMSFIVFDYIYVSFLLKSNSVDYHDVLLLFVNETL